MNPFYTLTLVAYRYLVYGPQGVERVAPVFQAFATSARVLVQYSYVPLSYDTTPETEI